MRSQPSSTSPAEPRPSRHIRDTWPPTTADPHEVGKASEPTTDTTDSAIGRFRRWFWRPPRAHGDIIEDRTVGFLELFCDLVYVVVIAQAAHHLAEHDNGRGVLEFAIVSGLIWIAWLNGTLYVDLHGREDGRTRTLVFVQMAILALLAAFTGGAGSKTGTEFALIYVAFMLLLTWMWWAVRRQDDPRFNAITGRDLVGMVATSIPTAISAFLPHDLRLGHLGGRHPRAVAVDRWLRVREEVLAAEGAAAQEPDA